MMTKVAQYGAMLAQLYEPQHATYKTIFHTLFLLIIAQQ